MERETSRRCSSFGKTSTSLRFRQGDRERWLSCGVVALTCIVLASQVRGGLIDSIEGYHFVISDVDAYPGQPLTITVEGAHENSVQGFSFAARYPAGVLNIEEIHIRDTILEAIGVDFFRSEANAAEGFITVGCLVDAVAPFEGNLIPNIGRPLAFFSVEAVLSEDAKEDLQIALVDRLGFPPTENLYVVDNEHRRVSELSSGTIRVAVDELRLFLRGDANVDAKADISDAVTILEHLFAGSSSVGCLDAADVNDDSEIDITDAIFLLDHLFLGGQVPPAPGMSEPGPDPSEDGLDCENPLMTVRKGP